jgi:UDP-glucose 4-epimerase
MVFGIKMPTNKILVVGGAGFIGSHMSEYLYRLGYEPVVLDDLSTGHAELILNAKFIQGSTADVALLDQIFSSEKYVAVMHFAAFIQVGESVRQPNKYYQNNFANTLNLLNAMHKHQVNNLIFSSTAAVYGEPQYSPIDELHPRLPINPYGQSKFMVEQVLQDMADAYDFKYIALRYFNAAGADPDSQLHECHEPETHLIPLLLQAALDPTKKFTVYGCDYPTPDGTCIRDYVHVLDLCQAHYLALKALQAGGLSTSYNLGNGAGFSVQQVIDAAKKITQKPITINYGARRVGDPAVLVANADRARVELNWQPVYADLNTIIQHVWKKLI